MTSQNTYSRILAVTALLTAGALALTACSAAEDTADAVGETVANTAADTSSDSAATTSGEMRTLTDSEGNEVELPADPQRIVTLHFAATEALVDLGLVPVGQGGYSDGLLPADKAKDIENVPIVNDRDDMELEAIAALEPDLILVPNYVEGEELEQLRAIAPSYVYTHGGEIRSNWNGPVAQIADAVNQTDKIDELETALAQRQAEIKDTYSDVLSKHKFAVINSYNEQEVDLNSDTSMLGKILGPAGVKWSDDENAIVGDEEGGELTVSLERINDAVGEADVLFYGTDLARNPSDNWAKLTEEDLYKNLKAVQNEQVYPIGKMTVAGYTDAMFTLDVLEEALQDLQS